MVRAHANAQIAARTMIQVETEVILIIAAAVEHHAVFPLVHVGKQPVGLAAILGNVHRVPREITRIEEAIHLVVEGACLKGIVLKARVNGIGNALFTGNHLTRRIQKLALLVRQK